MGVLFFQFDKIFHISIQLVLKVIIAGHKDANAHGVAHYMVGHKVAKAAKYDYGQGGEYGAGILGEFKLILF